jgi:glycosyltransferase involved in cell wall biosynthesis
MTDIELSVVIPCLNEEPTIGIVVRKSMTAMKKAGIKGEVVVADNGSKDNSVKIAKAAGARVVHQPLRGYGNAYHKGFSEAHGKYLIMTDADDTYPMQKIPAFVKKLREGNELVMGNRLDGQMAPGAMPRLHQYLGNPVLSWMVRHMFHTPVHDSHCGMRGFTADAWKRMDLHTTGMEFASEMVIRASQLRLKVAQFSIPYYPRRGAPSKLHSFRDGWRHLRFMLLYSPLWLFLIPALVLFVLGIVVLAGLAAGPVSFGTFSMDYHWMFLGSLFLIVGYQVIVFGLFTTVYRAKNLQFDDPTADRMGKYFTLDDGLIIGFSMTLAGLLMLLILFVTWWQSGFTVIGTGAIRYTIIGSTLMILGIQTVFSAFFLSILGIEKR